MRTKPNIANLGIGSTLARMGNKEHRRFGLIGHPLGHSLSPQIHQGIMDTMGIAGEYQLYDIGPDSLAQELPQLLKELDGINCTIPHKQAVMPFLSQLAPSANLYGAVNTVFNGEGHNTDGAGFAACRVEMSGHRVCVTGAGGVSRVLAIEAARAGATRIVIDARNTEQRNALVRDIRTMGYNASQAFATKTEDCLCQVLLNGTPVGMWPNTGGLAVDTQHILQAQAVFDTIYNPTATRLVLKAKSHGIPAMGGLTMLYEQALASQRIWNPSVDFDSAQNDLAAILPTLALKVLQNSPIKLLLTGYMGSGKTRIGRDLSNSMPGCLPFVDLDELVVQRAGKGIPEIFSSEGEASFRALERQCLLEQLQSPGSAIIATGGGALIQPGVDKDVRAASALVIYLDVTLETATKRLAGTGTRPLLSTGANGPGLYKSRLPLYQAIADYTVQANGHPAQIVNTIKKAFNWDA